MLVEEKPPTTYLTEKESFFWMPEHLDVSAWIEHIPFAFWIIEILKPRTVVELGVHNGVSYFSFCQAIERLNTGTACYGVDTWKGDEHAGFYGDNVFERVMEHNQQKYSKFSTLIRSTFDEASNYFTDGSIDLLHIDGLHTYEAVKHDFEKWLPRLSHNAVVIFHDINVRERGFGVFKFWEELKLQYKNFQFDFGYGLGIIATGNLERDELKALFNSKDQDLYYIFLRNLFSERGRFFKTQFEYSNSLNKLTADSMELKSVNDNLDEKYKNLSASHEQLKESRDLIKATKDILEKRYNDLQETKEKLAKSYSELKQNADLLGNELVQARKHEETLRKHLEWFTQTYEKRSLAGVIWEKLKNRFKRIYIGLIDSQLKKESIQKKYAVSYSLNYIKENGIRYSIARAAGKVRKEGFKSISRSELRQKAMKKIAVTENPQVYKQPLPVIPSIDTEGIKQAIAGLRYRPKISIIVPTYNIKASLLELAIRSVKNQLYTNWELCIADDCSTRQETIDVLKKYQKDDRVKTIFLDTNSGISVASNAAIGLSTGEYIALLDHDDEIPPDALYWIVNELNQYPGTDIIYSDECKIDEAGNLSDYFYKPDWSPELLMNMMYTGHLTVYKKNFLLEKVGPFRKEYDFSQDYDLMLRAVEKTDQIRHIPRFLYYWRITEGSAAQGDKPYARVTNLAALADAGKRRGLEGEIFEFPVANRLKIKVKKERKVSLIIPTDSYVNLKETIESILRSTSYPNYEIVPVTNSKLVRQMKEIFSDKNISYCIYDKPFNFSDKCNAGALHAAGEIVIFFNDDVRPLQDDWIENTIEFFEIPEIGGISPKLLYENDTIQYAGMITGVRNLTGTSFHCHHKDATLYLNYPQLVRDVSILSGACLAMRKELFLQLGGFDIVNTPVGHSDVDLSFRILEAGYRCLYTPYATLRHVGHLSLKEHEKEEEVQLKKDKADIFLLKRWIKYLDQDKYFPVGMRDLLYIDSPEPYQLYKPNKEQIEGEKGDVILVSHDLSLSGAPIMLYDTAKVLTEQEYFVIVFCPADGPLRKMYQDAGIPVIIDQLVLQQHHTFERFAKNFDYIICNTVVTWPVVKQMQHIVKTIWWIQEGQTIQYFTHDDEFVNTIRHARHLVGVSDYNISFVKPYNNKITKIHNACYDLDDHNVRASDNNKEKIIFTLVGSIERRKGHDVLVEALEAIDPALLKKAEVWFIGRTLKEQYLKGILPRIDSLGVIKMLGERSHDECLELMKQSDVILNISRDDPFPVVLVEAMCMGKTCVVSTNSGLAELIENGQNGFVFKNEDSADLTQKLSVILQNKADLEVIGKKARKTYKQHLTIEVFSDKLEKYMQQIEEAELV